ncbi:hypothetical protein ACJJTC_012361 [Scirpophaga incertulas]
MSNIACMGSVTAPVLRASGGPTRAYIVADGFHAWVLSQLRCCGPPAVPRELISSQMVFMHGFCHSSGAAGLQRSHASLYRRRWFSCMGSVTAPVLRASGGPTRAYIVADGFRSPPQLRLYGRLLSSRAAISKELRAPSKATALAKGSIPSTSSRPSRTFSEVTVRPVGAIGEMEMSLVGASHIPVVSPVKPIQIDIDVLAQALAAAGVSGGSTSASAAASVAAGAASAPAAAGLTAVGEGQLSAAGAVSAAGSALVSGALPATGLVSFQGLLPAAGSVILAGNCGCGCPVCAA